MNEEEKRNSFVVYTDWLPFFHTSEQVAYELIHAMIAYTKGEEVTNLSPEAQVAFNFIAPQMDSNFEKYDAAKQRRAEGRRRQAEEKKSLQDTSSNLKSLQDTSSNLNELNQPVNGNENVNVNVNENGNSKESESNDSPKKSSFSLRDVPKILNSFEILRSHPEIKEIIYDYYKMRQKIKKPLSTENAVRLTVEKAIKLGDGDPDKIRRIFENSVINSWQGIFAIKEEAAPTPPTTPITPKKSNAELFDELYKEAAIYDGQNNGSNTPAFFPNVPGAVQ